MSPARTSGSRGGSRRGKSNVIKVDFSGVETRKKVEEGEYEVAVSEVSLEEGPRGPYLKWIMKVDEGSESDGGTLYHNTSLVKDSLWSTKAWLEALGIAIEDDEMELDIEAYVDERCMVSVELETFEGKKRPKIVDYWAKPAEKAARGGKPGKEEKPARGGKPPTGGKPGKRKPEPEKDMLTQDQITDMGEDELEDIVKEYDFDVDLDKFRTLRKKQAAVIDAAEKAEVLSED